MIDAIIHYRGSNSERRRLPAVPVVGCYIIGPGAEERRPWIVSAVVVVGVGSDHLLTRAEESR